MRFNFFFELRLKKIDKTSEKNLIVCEIFIKIKIIISDNNNNIKTYKSYYNKNI